MLQEYEDDHGTGMDVSGIAGLLYEYTMGYPFLVSRICQLMDKKVGEWTKEGFLEAVKILVSEKNALFDSLINKVIDYPEIKNVVYEILFRGDDIAYNSLNQAIDISAMLGFIRKEHNRAVISNRIFETILYNYFLSEEIVGSQIYKSGQENKNKFSAFPKAHNKWRRKLLH